MAAPIYTANAAIELYAEVFDEAGALDRLEAFAIDLTQIVSFHQLDDFLDVIHIEHILRLSTFSRA